VENRGNWLLLGALALVLGGLVVAAVLIAGGDDEAGPSTTGDTTTTTSSSTTTTTAPTTTTVPLSPEDEIRRSAAQLFELRDEVLMNPDPSRILEYAEEQSPLYANDRGLIDSLIASNARWAGDPGRVLGVRLEANEGGSPRVTVVVESYEVDIVDTNGNVLQQLPSERRAYSVSLLGSPGSWQINDFLFSEQVLPTVIDQIVALGVP
jgi:hypothetical protein